MKISKELKTGLLAIAAIAILIFGYNFLKGENLLKADRTFYAVYKNVEGLSPSSSVTINGLEVGKVTSIDFLDRQGNLVVTFNVKRDFQFSKNSKAQIYGGGLIGGKSLAIIPEYERGKMAESGDTLIGTKDEGIFELVNNRLTPLQNKLEHVLQDTDSVLTSVNDVLDKDTRQNLRQAIADFSATASSFKGASASFDALLKNNDKKLSRTFTNLDEITKNFSKISDTLSKVEVGRLVANMERVIADFEEISSKLQRGEGTAGKLLNDEQLYNNLERATREMEMLMQDIKLNPKRYVHFSVFGKNPGPYDAPQDTINEQ